MFGDLGREIKALKENVVANWDAVVSLGKQHDSRIRDLQRELRLLIDHLGVQINYAPRIEPKEED